MKTTDLRLVKRNDYENDEPLADSWTILDLLYRRWGDTSIRRLSLWPHAPPHVEISYEGGDHGRGAGNSHRYLVEYAATQSMLVAGLLEGKKEWGYTEMRELYISERGSSAINAKWKELGGCSEYGRTGEGIPAATMWLARRRW